MITDIKTQGANPLNPSGSSPLNRAAFNMSARILDTYRLADISPTYVYNGLTGDKVTLTLKPSFNSYTLAAPLLSNLVAHNAAFSVPLCTILPRNYDLYKVPPKIGSDCPSDVFAGMNLSTILDMFYALIKSGRDDLVKLVSGSSSGYSYNMESGSTQVLNSVLRFALCALDFYSDFSPLRRVGISTYSHSGYNYNTSVGEPFSQTFGYANEVLASEGVHFSFGPSDNRSLVNDVFLFLPYMYKSLIVNTTDDGRYDLVEYDENVSTKVGTINYPLLRDFLQRMLDGSLTIKSCVVVPSTYMTEFNSAAGFSTYMCPISALLLWFYRLLGYASAKTTGQISTSNCFNVSDVNISALYAYQMAVSEFFTNDNLDEVCTSAKYLSRLQEYSRFSSPSFTLPYFEVNDMLRYYDVTSYNYFEKVVSCFCDDVDFADYQTYEDYVYNFCSWLYAIFGTRSSLIYENYWLSAKTRPLASTTPDVSSLSSFDVFRSVLVTKYMNAVNRMPQKVREFCNKMFHVGGGIVTPQPTFLGHSSSPVTSSDAVGTTSDNLGVRNSYIKSENDGEQITFVLNDDSVVIVVTYFDVPRCDVDFTSPFAYKFNRFDEYQPFFEGLGDDSCPLACVNPSKGTVKYTDSDLLPYGYLPRFSEYRVGFSRANGGFCSSSSNVDDWGFSYTIPFLTTFIEASSIRYRNSDFDRFFSSLTGLGDTYFHLIADTKVSCAAERNVSYTSDVKLS